MTDGHPCTLEKSRFGSIFSFWNLGTLTYWRCKGKMAWHTLRIVIFYDWWILNCKTNRKCVLYLIWLSPVCHFSKSLCVPFEKPKRFARSLCISNVGQNIPGQNRPCHFLPPRTKHPASICHPGQNIPCSFCHPGQNIPCHFCRPGQNIPCYFCHPGQNIPHSV